MITHDNVFFYVKVLKTHLFPTPGTSMKDIIVWQPPQVCLVKSEAYMFNWSEDWICVTHSSLLESILMQNTESKVSE